MIKTTDLMTIGEVADRTGVSVSALRYYEEEGLIAALRSSGGQRRFVRGELRRISFVMISQQLGFSLAQIKMALDSFPKGRTPTKADWAKLSRTFKGDLDKRIEALVQLRKRLDGCIGCGCLSLKHCALYNAEDKANKRGVGPRYIIGDQP